MAEKKNKFWLAWVVVAAYFAALALTVGPARVLKFFLDENTGLNNLGDFLAGVFAFPAFVLLAAAVVTQRQELRESREQFKNNQEVIDAQLKQIDKQNDLAQRAAKANYKLSIYDKRISVYVTLKNITARIIAAGTIDEETRDLIYEATESAHFVFGDDVGEYVNNLKDKSNELYVANFTFDYLERKRQKVGLNADGEIKMDEVIDKMQELDKWFMENMTYEILEERFTSSLKLPDDI